MFSEKIKNFEKICRKNLVEKYSTLPNELNKIIITNIIYNNRLHIVSSFKEFLIYYDPGEFFSTFYSRNENKSKIISYCQFYHVNSLIFPNYVPLPESKYIYINIKRKQKLIDKLDNFFHMEMSQKFKNDSLTSQSINHSQNSYYSTIFTPSILNSIKNDIDKSESKTSSVNFIIDNINKNKNFNDTPKNMIKIDSRKMKKKLSLIEIYKDKNKNKKKNIPNKNNIKNKLININLPFNILVKSRKNSKIKIDSKISKKKSHIKTQSNENIFNENKIYKDNESAKKFSIFLKTNNEIISLKNKRFKINIKKLKKINEDNFPPHIKSLSNITLKNYNKKSLANKKLIFNKLREDKTFLKFPKSKGKKIASLNAKSMPKLMTTISRHNTFSKRGTENKIFISNYHSLQHNYVDKLNNISKSKFTQKKYVIKNKIKNKEKSMNDFYSIIQKNVKNNIEDNIKYNLYNIKKNYSNKSNINRKIGKVSSLGISLGNLINNTFNKCYNNSKSNSKSINKSNSMIKIIDENSKQNIYHSNKIIGVTHKNGKGMQTERVNISVKGRKKLPNISLNTNFNEINTNSVYYEKLNDLNDNHKIKKGSVSNKYSKSSRLENNMIWNKSCKNSKTEIGKNQTNPTTHRVFNKFGYDRQVQKILEDKKDDISQNNKNVYLINNYNINNTKGNNDNNMISTNNIKHDLKRRVKVRRNLINKERGANIIININNNIFHNNKNSYFYNNYMYNSSSSNNISMKHFKLKKHIY